MHLTDEDFQATFKMSFKEFSQKPLWRQKELKKTAKLF
jgi:hypothetical protein